MNPPPEACLSEDVLDYYKDKESYRPSHFPDLTQPYQKHLEQKALLQLTPATLKAVKKYFK